MNKYKTICALLLCSIGANVQLVAYKAVIASAGEAIPVPDSELRLPNTPCNAGSVSL